MRKSVLFISVACIQGAEAIFLHVIRPLIKPYTETVDLALEIVCMFGDVLFTLSSIPFKFALTWWQHLPWMRGHTIKEFEALVSSTTHQHALEESAVSRHRRPGSGALRHTRSVIETTPHRRRRGTRHIAEGDSFASRLNLDDFTGHTKSRSESSTQGRAAVSRSNSSRSIRSRATTRSAEDIAPVVPLSSHEIWHPLPAARAEDEGSATVDGNPMRVDDSHDAQVDLATPPVDATVIQQELVVEEWRLYPPFPSAYPPTPMPPTSKLPDVPAAITSRKRFPTILEDQEDPEPSDATTNHSESSFAPGPAEEAGNDGDAEDEDDFSLRTPPPIRPTATDDKWNLARAKSKTKSRPDLSRVIPFLDVTADDSTRTGSLSTTESSLSDSDSFSPKTRKAKNKAPTRNGDVSGLSESKASTWSLASGRHPGTSRHFEEPAEEMGEKSSGKGRLEEALAPDSRGGEPAKTVRPKSKATRGIGQEAPTLRVSTRLANARRVGERTSSQDSTAGPSYSQSTLPRNARTRK
jgi:hypothetical protein